MSNFEDLNVSLICASASIGGTEQIVRLLAEGLHEGQAKVRLVTMGDANAAWLSTSGVQAQAEPRLHATGGGMMRQIMNLRKSFRPLKGSVANVHYPTFDIYRSHIIALHLAGCRKIVVSLHHPNLEAAHRAQGNRKLLRQCQSVVVTTEANRRFALENGLVDPGLLRIVAPGIPDQRPVGKQEARAQLGLPADKFLVGVLCRLAPEKRVEEVIEACRLADPDGQRLHLVIGGRGPETEKLKAMAGDNVTMIGWIEDANVFYSALDAFVMLSELEGFGLAYVEAAIHGAPSIGCDTGGTPDAILQGESGYLVPFEAPAANAAKHIKDMLDSPELVARLGEAAKKRALELFTAGHMVESYAQVYRGKH